MTSIKTMKNFKIGDVVFLVDTPVGKVTDIEELHYTKPQVYYARVLLNNNYYICVLDNGKLVGDYDDDSPFSLIYYTK